MTTERILSAMEPVAYEWTDPAHQRPPELNWHCDCGPAYEGWQTYPLYTRDQIIAAVKADRAAIVAWLRNEGTLQIDTGYDAGVYGGQGMHFAADQIEARAYIPTPPAQDTQP